ncbi:LysR family transcriptional regulator [Coprobacillaceae bacterium CR2/5/TPMF4]|nr:LysR family transcriptional regulator [Coprobacillaceae bacterium CR2/5/TPMF4]
MIELYQLEQLVTIAKAGTISKAAEILLISQPGLTRSIQRLEDELGLKLFDRKKNKITLNDNGIMAVEYAKKILDETDKMVKQLQSYDLSKRTISIGSCAPAPNWGLTYIFKQLYPAMKITDSLDSNEDNLLNGLDNHEYSIIAINHPINDDNRICIPLFEEHLYLSVPLLIH